MNDFIEITDPVYIICGLMVVLIILGISLLIYGIVDQQRRRKKWTIKW